MGKIVTALAAGLLFGLGLAVSRMIDPAKVLGFLDVAGDWDPSLALVMGGALAVTIPAYRLARGAAGPWLEGAFHLPTAKGIDARLIAGAVIFGIGWGLVGLCPGPAIAGIGLGNWESLVFAAAMGGGFIAVGALTGHSRVG
ncbi:MAG: DUF6691 family protein [Rhodospirillaceae bacterium]